MTPGDLWWALLPPVLLVAGAGWARARLAAAISRLQRARPGLIRSLTPGEWAWVEGEAEALQALLSPHARRPVAYYEYAVVDLGDRGQILQVHEDDASSPALLLRQEEHQVQVAFRPPQEADLEQLYQEETPVTALFTTARTRRLVERGIPVGVRLAAWGQVEASPTAPGGLRLAGEITRRSREELLAGLHQRQERWSGLLTYLPWLLAAAWLWYFLVLR